MGSTSEGASNLYIGNRGSGSSGSSSGSMGMVSRINRSTKHRLLQTNLQIGQHQRLGKGWMGAAMMTSKKGRALLRQKEGLLTPTPYNMGLYEDDPYGGRQISQYGRDTGFTGDFRKWERSQARIKENEKYKKERIKREAATQAKIDSYWGAPAPPPDQSTINMSPYSNQ